MTDETDTLDEAQSRPSGAVQSEELSGPSPDHVGLLQRAKMAIGEFVSHGEEDGSTSQPVHQQDNGTTKPVVEVPSDVGNTGSIHEIMTDNAAVQNAASGIDAATLAEGGTSNPDIAQGSFGKL